MKKALLIIGGVVLAIVVLVGLLYFLMLKIASNLDDLPSGENVSLAMNEEERQFFMTKIKNIDGSTTEAEVAAILGPPIKEGSEYGDHKLEEWSCPVNDQDCLIRVKFIDGKVVAVEWLKMNIFFYKEEYENWIELETLQSCTQDEDCTPINYRCDIVGVNKESNYEAFIEQEGYRGPCNQKNSIPSNWKITYCEDALCNVQFDCRDCGKVNEEIDKTCNPPCAFCSSLCNALESCNC